MLPKKLRLKRKEAIKALKDGANKKTKLFIVQILRKEDQTRFAVTISRKFDKKAVRRNKVRRRIQEAIRTNLETLKSQKGFHIALIPKKICLEKSYKEIEEDIIYILQNIEQWADS